MVATQGAASCYTSHLTNAAA